MKKIKHFLSSILEENRLKGEISQIINGSHGDGQEKDLSSDDYREVLVKMYKIIGLRKSINLNTKKEEDVILVIEELVRDLQVLEGIRNGEEL